MPGAMMPKIRTGTVPQTVPIKSISAFRRTSGMNLPEISLFRCTTIKQTTKENSLILSALLALLGGVATYFISGHALRPIREFSEKLRRCRHRIWPIRALKKNKVKELNQLRISYNKMLERLADAFEIQRQFTANAAHELRTPLSVMQVQLDLYHSTRIRAMTPTPYKH